MDLLRTSGFVFAALDQVVITVGAFAVVLFAAGVAVLEVRKFWDSSLIEDALKACGPGGCGPGLVCGPRVTY